MKFMSYFITLTLAFLLSSNLSAATQICVPSITPTAPDERFIDNGDGTITDLMTNLMWKKCVEGISGTTCSVGIYDNLTWQEALQRPVSINTSGGFASYTDWRLPNIRELQSLTEEQCYLPSMNKKFFPEHVGTQLFWSSTSAEFDSTQAWALVRDYGLVGVQVKTVGRGARLVRDLE